MVSKRSGTDQSTEQRAQYSQTANTSTESPFINSVSNTGKIKQHKTGESNKIKSKTVDSQLKPSDPTNLDEYDDIRHSGIYNSRGIGW
ncbi:unnamed protein product [[Candida] boidinii]|uniref:Unnamed protein product n=1 Tax=Candida boidinii TaxID=5477 RepID=A0A9W6WJB9_CANBO|nr:unnamed protein product [[Candida] boidinii]